ncbi:MAG: cell division protein FtsZ [Thaumarchaeota archaeon]|nr:cell division protein FtsZ [Nitrososphaerota archaeon]MDE0526296.1 cell division protein FtsZ [Nitrososphaerota archaeon]
MSLQMQDPMLVVGIGGAGSKLARRASGILECDSLLISNDKGDLEPPDGGAPQSRCSTRTVAVGTGAVINPTVGLVRAAAYEKLDAIRDAISGHPTVILMGNLAGKSGCAICPAVSEACAAEGAKLVSFAVMPFGHEKSRLFHAGVALRRLRETSACVTVVDNDSISESNPDLSPKECYDVAGAAVMYAVDFVTRSELEAGTESLLAAGRNRDSLEESLRDALKTVYGSTSPGAIRHSVLYVAGGEDVPAGLLRSVAALTEGVLGGGGNSVPDVQAPTAETASVQAASSDESRVIMMSTVQGMAKFERYDPLGAIPADKTLDWSTPECSIDCKMPGLYQLE